MSSKLSTRIPIVPLADLAEIQRLDGVELIVCPAQKCAHNPILPLGEVDQPDSVQARSWCGSALYDDRDRLFKMWYCTADHDPKTSGTYNFAYATSGDDVNWQKPILNLKDYRGSRENNLVLTPHSDDINLKGLIQDWPGGEDPSQRLAMYAFHNNGAGGRHEHYLYFSGDGLRWSRGPRLPEFDWHHQFMFDAHNVFYDPQEPNPSRRFKAYAQGFWPCRDFSQKLAHVPSDTPDEHLPIPWLARITQIHKRDREGRHSVRMVRAAFSPDGIKWEKKFEPVLDPNDGREAEIHYCVVLPYAGQYFMLYEYAIYEPIFNKYFGDLRLAHSRDGEHFTRINPHQSVVPRGPRGQWDDGFVVTSDRLFVHDQQVWIYYSGCGEDWNHWPRGAAPSWAGASRGSIYKSQQGLATLGLERFTALSSRDGLSPGTALTGPIELSGEPATLWVNVSEASAQRSWLTAELLDPATLRPMNGFSQYDCDRVVSDGLRHRVTWKKQQNLPPSDGGRLAIRFCLHGAVRVHSFGFTPPGK